MQCVVSNYTNKAKFEIDCNHAACACVTAGFVVSHVPCDCAMYHVPQFV